MNREQERVAVVAEAIGLTYAQKWEALAPRQQERFTRDAVQVLAALDRWESLTPDMSEFDPMPGATA